MIEKGGGSNERRYYVAKSGKKGYGVFAAEFIPKNTFLGVYTGIRTNTSTDATYEWSYPSAPIENGEVLSIGTDGSKKGNMLRFVNDGKRESINCRQVFVAWNNRWFNIYITQKDIVVGEELTVSYGSSYWEGRDFID